MNYVVRSNELQELIAKRLAYTRFATVESSDKDAEVFSRDVVNAITDLIRVEIASALSMYNSQVKEIYKAYNVPYNDPYTEPDWQSGDIATVEEGGLEHKAPRWVRLAPEPSNNYEWMCIYNPLDYSQVGLVFIRKQLPERLVKLMIERREDI